ncbi:ribonuclease P protein component [Brachybacterium alimentarium]|uniref:Ribonuclease P protein component n=1 Tax=Brachybacterium alimentarium TaxID=47845 RepID=A0A2A3YGT6_9MICO|nr:ribonuclease P protein component [Brachybacterium alimentarium]PCC31061.1 ribonuclease P protein component [Brachybacterium alimentarium]PCC38449.1 ribonuclease P protein component [Brachybacterium alimentarium]RCS67827.1 ribonuclease P protein component [Brachybacterium alimentarium]RCS74990.1 ribonuclease P protein component [Brachybacterium alimentarium]RCS77304.1 ribonuclease P protein component [Brachybacterium alimentarium]
MNWSSHRLHTGDEFRAVTRGGVRSARSHVVVHLSLLTQEGDAPRVGFVVSKRIGNAVVRNRVTRRLREIVRSRFETLPPGSGIVLRALPGIDEQPFAELEADVVGALGAATRKLERRTRTVS